MPSAHDIPTLRKWTTAVATESGIKLRTTHSMMYRIWKRTTRIVSEFKRLRLVGNRQNILSAAGT